MADFQPALATLERAVFDHDWLFASVWLFVLGVLLSSVCVAGRLWADSGPI